MPHEWTTMASSDSSIYTVREWYCTKCRYSRTIVYHRSLLTQEPPDPDMKIMPIYTEKWMNCDEIVAHEIMRS